MGIPFVEWTCAICIGELMGIQWDINQEYHPVNLPGASKYWIFKFQTQKRSILGVGVKKRTPEWFLPFLTLRTFWSGKKRSKSVQNRSEAFWSLKKRSGVEITVQEFFFS